MRLVLLPRRSRVGLAAGLLLVGAGVALAQVPNINGTAPVSDQALAKTAAPAQTSLDVQIAVTKDLIDKYEAAVKQMEVQLPAARALIATNKAQLARLEAQQKQQPSPAPAVMMRPGAPKH